MKELHDSFFYMQSELTNYISNLQQTTSIKEKIESELRIARDIQMGMIPKIFPPFPARKEIGLYAVLNPAKEVGGDLYDFLMEGDKLYFAIGDVSGKGIPASLLMAVTRSLFRSVVLNAGSPAAVMNSLNASISENNDSNMFVTLFIGVLELKTGFLQYCNAGHNPPVVVAPNGECKWLEVIPNVPVGVMENFTYKEQNLTLPDSSHLVLYTDGVTEAENTNKELFGEIRLLNIIQHNPKIPPRMMIETLVNDIKNFVGNNEPSDDITLLVIEYDKQREMNNQTLIISNKIEEISQIVAFVEHIGDQDVDKWQKGAQQQRNHQNKHLFG
jgi:sigma-B regulation protein RsbU (phosphoserine phosphatase)